MYSAIVRPETDLREMLQAYLILFRMHVVLIAALVWAMGSAHVIDWLPAAAPADAAAYPQPADR
jgi:hypothetical protein